MSLLPTTKKAMMVHDASCTNEETFYFCSNRYSNMQEFELSWDCGLVFKFQFLVHFSCSKRTGGRTDVQRVRFSSTLFFPFNAFLRYKTNIFAFVMIVYSQRFFRIFFILAVLHVCDICFGFVSDFSFNFFLRKIISYRRLCSCFCNTYGQNSCSDENLDDPL